VRLPGDRRFVQSVRKAAAEMNFYTIDGHVDGPDAFEKLLSSIEGEAAKVFEAVKKGVWPLNPEHRAALAYFIALQAVRGPEQRRNMEHVAAQVTRLAIGYGGRANVAKWVQRKRGVTISEEQAEQIWEEATRPEGPPIRFEPIAHIKQMNRASQSLLPYIAGRPWTLVRFDRRSLITCDTPVGLVPHQDREPWEGVGFLTAWGITYPITRKLGLLMTDPLALAEAGVPVEHTHAGDFDRVEAGTTQMEKLFNQSTIESASLWVYHHPEDGRFLPNTLPDPSPVTIGMIGEATNFTGDPIGWNRNGYDDETPSAQ